MEIIINFQRKDASQGKCLLIAGRKRLIHRDSAIRHKYFFDTIFFLYNKVSSQFNKYYLLIHERNIELTSEKNDSAPTLAILIASSF